MGEAYDFSKPERVEVAEMPLHFKHGAETTKAGEHRYLDVKITDDYSIWGTLSPDQSQAWIEQINMREGIDDVHIAERLLKGFAAAANSIGARELWMASAASRDLYLFARVFGEQNLTFYDVNEGESVALTPMTLGQALDSIDRIQAKEEAESYPLISYFDVCVRTEAVDVTAWEQPHPNSSF